MRGSKYVTNHQLEKDVSYKVLQFINTMEITKLLGYKTLSGDFKVTTPENLLLSQQTVTSKWISVPYTNLQLNPYPNTQLDLFWSDNLSFSMHGSQFVTNQSMHGSKYVTNHQLEKDVGYKVLQFIHTMNIKKLLSYKILRRTNAIASSRERWTRINCLRSQYACNNLMMALKIILIYV